MWWSDRRRLILALAALPLAGCGFSPALAPGAPATALRGRIRADDPTDRAGVAFVARLEDRLGRPQAPGWRLGWAMSVSLERLGLAQDVGETRGRVLGVVTWTLRREGDAPDAAPVASGRAQSFAGYDRTGAPFAIRAAAEDASTRVAEMLAEAVAAELIATAPRWATPGAGP